METIQEKDDVHKFTWGSKLESRNSFLMILEHLPLEKKMISPLLKMLKPDGEKFFKRYCWQSKQFNAVGMVQREIVSINIAPKFWEVIG